MPQLDATTQGLEGLFQREGVQSVNCATGTAPARNTTATPIRRFSRFRRRGLTSRCRPHLSPGHPHRLGCSAKRPRWPGLKMVTPTPSSSWSAPTKDLFRLGFRMLSDRGEAQDAVQDTFVLAWRRLPSLLDPEAFRAWIYQLMTRRCLNILRVRVRRHTGVTSGPDFELEARAGRSVPAGSTTDPAAAAQTNAMQDCLTAVLATLPPDQRACWVARDARADLPAIAYAIGVPVSTVRGRIARARLQLAKGMTAWR